MITILHRGEGSLGTPKSDYVICARPLMFMMLVMVVVAKKVMVMMMMTMMAAVMARLSGPQGPTHNRLCSKVSPPPTTTAITRAIH